jgi:uncharacterized lipoprotein YddW (UPF0748 family)
MKKILSLFLVLFLASCTGNSPDTDSPTATPKADVSALQSRGVWLTWHEMIQEPEELSAQLDRFQQANLNTVYIVTQLRGFVSYPNSQYLPQWYKLASRPQEDLVQWLIDEIHQRGMRAEAWTEYGFYGYYTPDAELDKSKGVFLDNNPDLVALDSTGNAAMVNKYGTYYSLCPSNPKSHDLLINLYLEQMENYDFDGLHLDRVRYPNAEFCHCDYCKEHFKKDTGMELLDNFAEGSDGAVAFDSWRKTQTHTFVGSLSAKMKAQFPKANLTAAVVPPEMIDEKGQNWPTWVQAGYVDAVMPMLYSADLNPKLRWIEEKLGTNPPVYAGISAELGYDSVQTQLKTLEENNYPGVTFWYATPLDPMLPQLTEEFFQTPQVSPLSAEQNSR